MICPLCLHILNQKKDQQFYTCKVCGALVRGESYRISKTEEKTRYEAHHNNVHNSGYQNFVKPIAEAILKAQKPEHKGLDYGCGRGPVVSHLLQQKGYSPQLYDPFFYPNPNYLNSTYHYIFSCEVFEHFLQPKQEIEKLLKLLKPLGNLYIMTHLYHNTIPFNNWYYRKDATHVFIYTQNTIHYIARHYNLQITHLDERLVVLKKK